MTGCYIHPILHLLSSPLSLIIKYEANNKWQTKYVYSALIVTTTTISYVEIYNFETSIKFVLVNAIQALHERPISCESALSCERKNREDARAFLRLQNVLSMPDVNGRKKRRHHNKDKAPVDVNPSSSSKG